jgi:hypothetical protein
VTGGVAEVPPVSPLFVVGFDDVPLGIAVPEGAEPALSHPIGIAVSKLAINKADARFMMTPLWKNFA